MSETTKREQAGARKPIRMRIPADLETPVSAFLKLEPLGASFLLESVEQGIQMGRYSFIGVAPEATVRLAGDTVTVTRRRNGASGPEQSERREHAVDRSDPFAPVRELLAAFPLDADEDDELPAPLGGAIGYVGYDMARYFEKLPLPPLASGPAPGFADYELMVPRTLAVFDHVKSEIELFTLPAAGDPAQTRPAAERELKALLDALAGPLPEGALRGFGPASGGKGTPSEPTANMSREDFEAKVRQAKEHILAGDIFQVVLSQRLSGQTEVPPFQIYRALRILNPSPYLFFLDFGDAQIIGSSPEMLVKFEGGQLSLNPIAGTRPRGRTPSADRELERDLLEDEKERAEHVMLVDLGRNDLGRVCELGSVEVEDFMTVERYSHVMHIVSRVVGRPSDGVDAFGALRATFPAGTVTGAPKIRAMEIIADLEGQRRGPYAGAVGYFGQRGDMDMCIGIRTLFVRGNDYFAQAGAGIVADSDPGREYQETLNKIRALTRAVTIAEEGF